MDIESLKKIDFLLQVKKETQDTLFSKKKKKPKDQKKEEKSPNRVDVRV